jgi:hypothetical protein
VNMDDLSLARLLIGRGSMALKVILICIRPNVL